MLRRVDRLFRRYQKTGDPRALGAVFDRTAPELLRVGLHLTRDLHRAEDLLQSTFLTAMERTDRYDPKRPVVPWLVSILANRAREWSRRDRRDSALGMRALPVRDGDEGDRAGDRELARACEDALDGLPEPYRHVLILHLRHGLSGVEIARAHGRPESTVRNQIARGLKILRRTLPAVGSSVAVIVSTGGRGLAAVREAVLARVPRGTGAAMTGASVSLGVLLMSKKLVWSVVVLAALAAGSWYLNALGDVGIPEPTVGPSEGLVAAGVQALDPPAEEADPVSSQPLDRAPLEGQVETGSLRVEVVVRDEGTTAAGMPFELWRFAGERRDVLAWGRTGMDGVASFDELSPGSYFFEVFRGNGTPWQTTPRIVAGQQETRRLEIAPGWNLQGRVVDRYGRPVGGAEVRVEGRSGRPDILLARSEEDGSISASHLAGSVRVWALLPGLQPSKRHQLEERLGTAEIRLVLGEPGSRLAGVVENEHGEPVSGALVFIGVPLHLGSHFEQHELHSLRAEEDGRFEVSWLPPGRIFVGALPADEDHARATGRWVEIGPLGAASVVLGLGDGATLVGQVRDRLTGEPVQGVHVSTSPRDDFGLSAISHVFAETDEEGHYRLEGLIAGTHRVAASHGNFLVEGEVAVVRGQQQRWDIELVRGGSFHVRVLGPDGEPLTRWTIELRRKEPGGWRAQAYALTDTGGLCEFSDLRDGEYMVRGLVHGELVVKDAVAAFERRGLVPDERVVTIRVPSDQMPRARILGRVLDSKGEPVLDADVRLYQEPVYGSATLEVDREGRFKTGLLPPGRYSISAHAPSIGQVYAHGMYEVEADQELDVGDLVLGESSRLEVHLVAEDGFPVTDPVLVLGDPRDVTPGAYDLQADEVDGVYRAEGFEPRQYELRFFAADALPQILTLELLPGDTRRLDLRVQRAHLVVLEIRCAEEIPGRSGMLNGLVTVTDSSGERLVFHRLSGYFDDYENRIERVKLALPPGEYGVDVREFGGRQVQTQIRVSEGTTEPFVIDLR